MHKKNHIPVTNPEEIMQLLEGNDGSHKRLAGWSGYMQESDSGVSNKSLILRCTKCKMNTSGIYRTPGDAERRCPSCSSILMHCPTCHSLVSATEKFSILTCDRCLDDFITNTTIEYLASRDRGSHDIVISGIRATGEMHIGNFLGAVRQFVEYEQSDNLCMYFIADWHTLTREIDPKRVSLNTIAIATDYLAAGLDPNRSIIYMQSSVPEISELALYLSMIQKKNALEDLPTVKDLVKNDGTMTMGHMLYPVLMAADILGTKATLVPVGADQIPNIEFARDLARKFNQQFGNTFVIPKAGPGMIKVPGLTGGKMGKSESTVSVWLSDSLKEISDKYTQFGVTDIKRRRRTDPGNPDDCASVYPVFRILNDKKGSLALDTIASECKAGTRGCKECKIELAREINCVTQPFRERRKDLEHKPGYVKEVLYYGGLKVREIVKQTLGEVRDKMGIVSI